MSKLQEAIAKYSLGAGCGVEISYGEMQRVERVKIEFSGPAAHIPSLKNAKVIGGKVPYTNPQVTARLKVMDYLYLKAITQAKVTALPSFGTAEVVVVVVCARRKVAFDTDNCLSTVRDWMEPREKKGGRGKARGWGIGLVDNDRQVKGFVFYDKDLGLNLQRSVIVIQRWDECKAKIASFISELTFDIVGAGTNQIVN